jgi:hypothetical protein
MGMIVVLDESAICGSPDTLQGVSGVYIGDDVLVFIPLAVLERCSEVLGLSGQLPKKSAEKPGKVADGDYVSQETARNVFFELERLSQTDWHKLSEFDVGFIQGIAERLNSGMKLSAKQKMCLIRMLEKHADDVYKLQKAEKESQDNIPF